MRKLKLTGLVTADRYIRQNRSGTPVTPSEKVIYINPDGGKIVPLST